MPKELETITLKRQIEATEAKVDAFIERLRRILDKNLKAISAEINSGIASASTLETTRKLGQLSQILTAGGLDDAVLELRGIYADELDNVLEYYATFTEQTVTFSEIDLAVVEELINFDVDDKLFRLIDAYSGDLRSQMMRSVLLGQSIDIDPITQVLEPRLAANLQTELNTAMSGFNRAVTVKKGIELGFELMVYRGPAPDKVTRPFCEGLLARTPPVYTMDEVFNMDNGQGLDVATYGGGYNCRHHWRPIDEKRARAIGWSP